MYLKRLEISGFKSFANKTVLDFPNNVTSVVGPNGSGKSNVADAIKWVLGEQSMKSLRGKKSEDIIFSGSDKKARMSVATASLIFDNRDRKMPLDLDEVNITRKLFRNGESEYLINKSKVRLSDIIDLLASAGISQKGYCVINQGMADSILTATPQERMVIFEEATGVRKFQIKKEQTIKKLESTKKNLIRVSELLVEIEPHLNFLKRQASKAQRRGEVEEDLKKEQKYFYENIWCDLIGNNLSHKENQEKIQKSIEDGSLLLKNIKKELSENSDGKDSAYGEMFDTLQKKSLDLQNKLNVFQKNLSIVEGRIELEKENIEKAKSPEFKPINLGYVKEKISNIISLYESFYGGILNFKSSSDLEKIKKIGEDFGKNIKSLFSEIDAGRVCMKEAENVDDSNLRKFESERAEIASSMASVNSEYDSVRSDIFQLNKKEQEKRARFFSLEREFQSKQENINRFKDELNRINIEVAKFEVRKEDIINEIVSEFGESYYILEKIKANIDDGLSKDQYFNREGSEIKIKRLKSQLEQIGGIDPLIMEEYKETQERFEFLSGQAKDLEEASSSLKKVISELDEKVDKMFRVSFKGINSEFSRYFSIIFGGGKANISVKYNSENEEKENENDQEENGRDKKNRIAGIEIDATPPGKKISNLSMLSGGERALTSIAILFAIIAHNPPPFSVLDEIDAALDEANSFKLSRIIKEISDKTQFIIITHNREMMNQADILYGVTMQDDGVSKIISVNLEDFNK